MSVQQDEESASQPGQDDPNMTQRMVIVSINKASARIINIYEAELVCGRFEKLQVSAKFKHKSIYCDLTLKFYGLSAPEGPLCQVCFVILTFSFNSIQFGCLHIINYLFLVSFWVTLIITRYFRQPYVKWTYICRVSLVSIRRMLWVLVLYIYLPERILIGGL